MSREGHIVNTISNLFSWCILRHQHDSITNSTKFIWSHSLHSFWKPFCFDTARMWFFVIYFAFTSPGCFFLSRKISSTGSYSVSHPYLKVDRKEMKGLDSSVIMLLHILIESGLPKSKGQPSIAFRTCFSVGSCFLMWLSDGMLQIHLEVPCFQRRRRRLEAFPPLSSRHMLTQLGESCLLWIGHQTV